VSFYERLVKPSWVPPDWAFPAAWFTLWTLQAIALVRVVGATSRYRSAAVVMLAVQFAAAISWQAVVFGPGRLLLAAWWLVGVLVLVIATVVVVRKADRLAAALVVPTIAWVALATALAWSLYRLNPGA
jgi:translocator protein